MLKSEHGYKIGYTRTRGKRLRVFAVKLPFDWRLKHLCFVSDANKVEGIVHLKLAEKRINGEWFALDRADFDTIREVCNQYKEDTPEPEPVVPPVPKYRICEFCNDKFEYQTSRARFCSNICRQLSWLMERFADRK